MGKARSAIVVCVALAGCGRLGFDDDASCPTYRAAMAPYAAGTGSTDDPFQICSPAQLSELASRSDDLGSRFVLMFDLDFTGIPFEGIGTLAAPFTGFIDGNGHTISNLTITGAAGLPAGFVNAARAARIENVTLVNPVVAGSTGVGSVIGVCDSSHVRNTVVTTADIRGEVSVGGLVGEASECLFLGASLTGTVAGTSEMIGGVVGEAGASAFLDIDATVTVNAPLATAVGGIVGADVWDPVTVQNVVVRGDVVGNEAVGGLVGENDDGSQIYRTRFDGTVRGNYGVGGFAGANYDSPFHVYSTSVSAQVVGNTAVGGLSGLHYYRTKFFDSYFTGTLTGVGVNQASFGGFFGDVEYYGWVERSYVDVTIDSTASTAGGFMGRIGYWSGDSATYDVARSFAAAHVTGSSATSTISPYVGQNTDPNPLVGAGSVYWGGGTCVNLGGGGCGGGGTAIADVTQLQGPSGPLSTWDFTQVWEAHSGAFPALRLAQDHAPTVTKACSAVALVGLDYSCDIEVTDADVNEVRIAVLEPSHTCAWLTSTVLDVRGTPKPDHLGACTLAFSVTDGAHTTAPLTIPVEVHLGVVVTPAAASGTSFFVGFATVGSPPVTQVFTLTNREAVAVTDLALGGLPAGDFTFAGGAYPGTGGTCATTLAAGASCTVAITYTPNTAGNVSQPLDVRFTAARGPASYQFTIAGYGTSSSS